MTFLELAEAILFEVKKPLSVPEIWNYALEKGYDKKLNSTGKTPEATLGAQLYVSVKDNIRSPFNKVDTRPKKFYLKKQAPAIQDIEIIEPPIQSKKYNYLEKELHPYLVYFAYFHLHAYSKTINHSYSNKKEYGEWVHPDIVSCYFPLEEWKPEVYDLSAGIGEIPIKIISFEIKRELNFSNLRESFFQCVSNSSWANESYLVAADISKDPDFMSELRRLSSSFGIGIIELNIKDPDSTQVILTSKVKDYLDWETINKIAMNSDFKEFITRVKIDVSSKKIHKKEYDSVLELEELKKKILI